MGRMSLQEVVKQLGCSIMPWAGVERGLPAEGGSSRQSPCSGGKGLGASPCLSWSCILAPALPHLPGLSWGLVLALGVRLGLGGTEGQLLVSGTGG